MPPRLDLTHSTHAKVMVAPPRINLRRAASYNTADRGPLSATSSRFSFNHLLFSPPPSPSLPALIPRPKKSPTQKILNTRPSRVLRRLFYLAFVVVSLYFLSLGFRGQRVLPDLWPYFAEHDFEMVEQSELPDFPTPIMVENSHGDSKWTVSIPPAYDFPLSMAQYSDMCAKCREVSSRARDLHHNNPIAEKIAELDARDEYFVDVQEAEHQGLLSAAAHDEHAQEVMGLVGVDKDHMAQMPVCDSSLIFVLESPDAGIGNTLMMLWTFYGLAKEHGRAFFVDDSRWAYGEYGEIFQRPPIPSCRPPPGHHIVPCPAQARHLVVSALTARDIFPALLAKQHRTADSEKSRRNLFELARTGYMALFRLQTDDQNYVDSRIRELESDANALGSTPTGAPIIGLHVRRGDQHPLEYQYRDTYIPAEIFHEASGKLVDRYYAKANREVAGPRRSISLVASDDPTVHEESDFSDTLMAQERIRLASKTVIDEANEDPSVLHQFVDEAFGWEGGFFSSMFWTLGVSRKNNAANAPDGVEVDSVEEEAQMTATPSEQTLKLRSLIGRAYMMDLAVLSGASDHVVCAVSAMGCRLLAVMMGPWQESIQHGDWVNVDGEYSWTGIDW